MRTPRYTTVASLS